MKSTLFIALFCILIFSTCSQQEILLPVKIKTLSGAQIDQSNEIVVFAGKQVSSFRPVVATSSKWISRVIEYRPAPGQFINSSFGSPVDTKSIIGKRGVLTLGAYGGYVIFKFDHTIMNEPGINFVIHGNAFNGNSEPGAVMVAQDVNGDGIPGTWYELAGDDYYDATTVHDYEITYLKPAQTERADDVRWRDNQGMSGALLCELIKPYHRQSYWPLFLSDHPEELVFKGSKLRNLVSFEDGIWYNKTAGKGYVDNYSSDYMEIVAGDPDTERSNKFDLDRAVNAKGERVALKGIDFIKVYTCVNQQAGVIGEASTEVCGAISLTKK